MARRAQAVDLVVDGVDRDGVVAERSETMRQPRAAGAEVEHVQRQRTAGEHVTQADGGRSRAGSASRRRADRRRPPTAAAGSTRAIDGRRPSRSRTARYWLHERLEPLAACRRQKAPDAGAALERATTPAAGDAVVGRIAELRPAFRTGEARQPRRSTTVMAFRSTIRKWSPHARTHRPGADCDRRGAAARPTRRGWRPANASQIRRRHEQPERAERHAREAGRARRSASNSRRRVVPRPHRAPLERHRHRGRGGSGRARAASSPRARYSAISHGQTRPITEAIRTPPGRRRSAMSAPPRPDRRRS